MTVYFLQPGARRVVKIGFSATAVLPRMKRAQTYNPDKMQLLATIPGDRGVESRLHAQFGKDRIRNEWFRLSPEIRQFLQELPAGLIGEILEEARSLSHRTTKIVTGPPMEKALREYLLSLAAIYSLTSGKTVGGISRDAHGSNSFFARYRAGKCSVTLLKYDEMIQWFVDRWSNEVPFPELTILWDEPKTVIAEAKKISA